VDVRRKGKIVLLGKSLNFRTRHVNNIIVTKLVIIILYIITIIIQVKPSNTSSDRSWTYYNLGCALQEQGKLQEAINCYREAIALNPAHIEANYNMGSALQEIDALQEAEKFYKTTIALKPNHHM